MHTISLQSLSKQLFDNMSNNNTLLECKNILESYNGNDWEKYVKFSNTIYNKVYLDCSTDLFDLILICWNNGQQSTPHDHPDDGCLMKILDGELTEKIYTKNINTSIKVHVDCENGCDKYSYAKTNFYKKTQISYREGKNVIHDVINADNIKTVSLHIYAPPKYHTTYYKLV